MVEWWSYIVAWEGVFDEHDAPIAIMHVKPDGSEDRRNFDQVIGRLPFIEQVRMFLVQVALNGIQLKRVRGIVSELVNDEQEAERLLKELDPFFSPGVPPPGDTSVA
jgi:hypothetical protein